MLSKHPVLVAPSLLASDFGRVQMEVRRAERAGADWLHLDVMDGHFVDNISFGPAFVEAVARTATTPLDVHLMIERPDHFFARFSRFVDNITVHVEARHDVGATLAAIREAGCTRGLSLRPSTSFEAVTPFLEFIDVLLIMTVEPGFGGQAFMNDMLPRIRQAAAIREEHGYEFRIEVDGGINGDTGPLCIAEGADTLVAGTSLFAAPDMAAAVRGVRGQAEGEPTAAAASTSVG